MLTETREADIESLLQQGQAAAQQGDMTGAREALSRIVELEPNNEKAWLWLSGVVEDPAEQQICLENVLVINPSNESARQGLEFLQSQGVTTAVVENAEASMAAPIQAPSADPTAVPSYVDEPQGPVHDLTSPLSSVAVEEVEMFAPEAEVDVVPSWVPAPAPSNGFANAGNGFSEPTESSQMPWQDLQAMNDPSASDQPAFSMPFGQEPVNAQPFAEDFPFDTSSLRESDVSPVELPMVDGAVAAADNMAFDVEPFSPGGTAAPEYDFSSLNFNPAILNAGTAQNSAQMVEAPSSYDQPAPESTTPAGVLNINFEDHMAAQTGSGAHDSGFMELPAGSFGSMAAGEMDHQAHMGPMGPMAEAQLPPPTELPGYQGSKDEWSEPWYLEANAPTSQQHIEESAGAPLYSMDSKPAHQPKEDGTRAPVATMGCPNCREQVPDTSLACPNCRFNFFVNCPNCHELLDTSTAVAGRTEPCPHCKHDINPMALGSSGADGAIMYQSTKLNQETAKGIPAMQNFSTEPARPRRPAFAWVVDLVWLVTIIAIVWALTQLPTWLHLTGQY